MCRKFLGDLGVPSLPGGFLDVLSYFSRGGNENGDSTPGTGNISNVPIQNLQGPANINSGANTPLQDTTDSRDSGADGAAGVKGKGKEVSFVPQLSNISRMYVEPCRSVNNPEDSVWNRYAVRPANE
jgi:hypothetical protein